MSDDIRELEDQVIYLSRMIREVLSWMEAAEMSGSVPEGLRSRVQDRERLDGVRLHAKALRETLEMLESSGDMGTVRERLRDSLSDMEAVAEKLERRLLHEEA